jgi:hypothetical protein
MSDYKNHINFHIKEKNEKKSGAMSLRPLIFRQPTLSPANGLSQTLWVNGRGTREINEGPKDPGLALQLPGNLEKNACRSDSHMLLCTLRVINMKHEFCVVHTFKILSYDTNRIASISQSLSYNKKFVFHLNRPLGRLGFGLG